MNKKILVKDIVQSTNCYDREQGAVLYRILMDNLKRNHTLEVDFKGINAVTSAFLSSSFGELLRCGANVPIIKNHVKVTNLDNFSKKILNKVMTNKVSSLVADNPCHGCPYTDCNKHP